MAQQHPAKGELSSPRSQPWLWIARFLIRTRASLQVERFQSAIAEASRRAAEKAAAKGKNIQMGKLDDKFANNRFVQENDK